MPRTFGVHRETQIAVRLREDERQTVEQVARHEGRSLADVMRDYLPALRRRAKALQAAGNPSAETATAG